MRVPISSFEKVQTCLFERLSCTTGDTTASHQTRRPSLPYFYTFFFRFKKAPNWDTLPYPDSSSLHVLYTLCTFGGIKSLWFFTEHGSYLLWPVEVVLKVSFHPDIWATLVWIQRAIFTKWQFSRIECDLISIFRIACYISCTRVLHPPKRHHAEMDENYGPHYLVIFVQIYFQAASHICPAQIIQTLKIITICNSTSKPFWGYFKMR